MIALTALEVMLSIDRKGADGPKISTEAAVSWMRSQMHFVVGGGGGIPFPVLPAPPHAAMRHHQLCGASGPGPSLWLSPQQTWSSSR